jgi:hypothetical protein
MGITSLNDDQPGEIAHSSKSSMNVSVAVSARVPVPSQIEGVPESTVPLLLPLLVEPLVLPLLLLPLEELPLVLPLLLPPLEEPPLVLPLPPPLLPVFMSGGVALPDEQAKPEQIPAASRGTSARPRVARDVMWRISIHSWLTETLKSLGLDL